jgi:hypothetical protein
LRPFKCPYFSILFLTGNLTFRDRSDNSGFALIFFKIQVPNSKKISNPNVDELVKSQNSSQLIGIT